MFSFSQTENIYVTYRIHLCSLGLLFTLTLLPPQPFVFSVNHLQSQQVFSLKCGIEEMLFGKLGKQKIIPRAGSSIMHKVQVR